ncbi:MAG: ribulose-phosphate 3-epimerase, partial [Clostridia bacterium]
MIKVAPSVLAADFTALGEEARRMAAAGADELHVDIMDGTFVPNISFGACVVDALKKSCALPLDVHMMVQDPVRYIPDMVRAGASRITVHVEATPHIHRAIQVIRDAGVEAGVALNPGSPAELV